MQFQRRSFLLIPLVLLLALSPGCFWKWFGGDENPAEKEYDVYGTVEQITDTSLVLTTKRGRETFVMLESSFTGNDFGPGAYVHVYYRIRNDQKEVLRAFEKVDY